MATPKGVPGVSTPKNHLTSTPTRPVASPRTNYGAVAGKTLSYKSPAVKTPASLQGHSHRVSISSHPTSTPLAAPALHDELLNLNSPAAALIASIGTTGLTPMAAGQDGLGITTGITSQSLREPLTGPRNPELEKLNRLKQVVELLKPHTVGRGVTREGVGRVAQLHGFTILWDDDNLTIAGNRVDLEIAFDVVDRDAVRDVQLRLNTSGSEDLQLQKDASEVLKRHLSPTQGAELHTEAWKSLKDFSHDLEYLSQLDYADSPANCFDLMGGLYQAFSKIWNEEKKRMRGRHEAYHICQGNIGKPQHDRGDSLGVTSQYWVDRHHFHAVTSEARVETGTRNASYVTTFSCEKASPGIVLQSDWLEEEPLKTAVTTEDMFQEGHVEKPNWSGTSVLKEADQLQRDPDAMMMDGPDKPIADSLDLVFSCRLQQPVLIPISKVVELNGQYSMIQPDQTEAVTYQQALLNAHQTTCTQIWSPDVRWAKPITSYRQDGQANSKTHSYSLSTNGIAWVYPIGSLRFSHPKHYADAIPILRQYTLLWSILRNSLGHETDDSRKDEHQINAERVVQGGTKATVRKRSNKKVAQDALDDLLSPRASRLSASKFDITLDISNHHPKARIQIIIPVPKSSTCARNEWFLNVDVDIGPNGSIDVPSIRGLALADEEKLRQKAVKVLGLSEDVSVLIEWLLDETTQSS